MKKKHRNIVFVATISLLFILPGLTLLFGGLPDMSANENRRLAKFPDIRKNPPDTFTRKFDAWMNDHFSFRNLLLNSRMAMDIHWLQQSPIPSYVIIGKDNWLYNTGNEIKVYRGVNRYTAEELEMMYRELRFREEFIRSVGAKMYYAVSPVKYSVYPEFLPMNLTKVHPETRTDQFVKFMRARGMHILDFREALLKAKTDTFPLFYKGDNHWNFNGGYVAYRMAIDSFSRDFPSVGRAVPYKEYKVVKTPRLDGNLGKMLFLKEGCGEFNYTYTRVSPNTTFTDTNERYTAPSTFHYPESYEERYRNGKPKSPKILIIRDSFGYYLTHFLKENFSEVVSIFDAWDYRLNAEIIRKEKPDIVLFMVLESFTDCMMRHEDPAFPQETTARK